MPDVAWKSSVLSTGSLQIDASGLQGVWTTAIGAAIRELNVLFTANKVNVSLTAASPAEVTVALTTGHFSFPVQGVMKSDTLRTDILHGKTEGIDIQFGNNPFTRDQAFIFLPQNPKVNPKVKTSRNVGEPVMRVMAAHEFLHALGLDKHDPSFNGLFAEALVLNEGSKPTDDTMTPFGRSTTLPPLILSGDTVSRLQKLWP